MPSQLATATCGVTGPGGTVTVAGSFDGTLAVGPGSNLFASGTDMFVVSLGEPAGGPTGPMYVRWARHITGTSTKSLLATRTHANWDAATPTTIAIRAMA